jgi:amino acid transporter
LRKQNRGIALLIIAIVFLILAVLLIVVYTEDVNRRNSQISAFKEFAANHNYPLNTGTVSLSKNAPNCLQKTVFRLLNKIRILG